MAQEILTHTLPNGLRIIGEPKKEAASAAIGFFVKTGSRDETTKESGVSHFLEHMLFKGSEKRTTFEINCELGNIGAQANAFTSEENTVYYASILPEYFPRMHELLSDMMRPTLPQDEFDTEKKVILEEIALYQDRPHFYLFENAFREYFASHPAGNSVLGTTESVGAITRDEMQAYYERRYVASNIALVASGNFDWAKLIKDAERYSGSWPGGAAPRETPPFEGSTIERVYKKKSLSQAHLLWIAPGPSLQDDDRYAMTLVALMLGDSTGSRLYWELVDSGIAETAGADCDERDGTGVVVAFISTNPELAGKAAGAVEEVLARRAPFTVEELDRAKMKCVSRVVLNGELPLGRLMSLGLEWNGRRTLEPLRETIEKLRAVTLADVDRALARYPMNTWAKFRLLPE